MEISKDGNEKIPPLFAGIIIYCEIRHQGQSREADLYAVSGTIYLDMIKKSRSYQNVEMSYKEMIDNVLKDTPDSVLMYFAEKKMLEKPVIQYQETDFSFAIRMASHQNTCIYPDIIDFRPRLIYGLPKGKDKGEISVISYRMGMDSCYSKGTDKKEVLLFYEITCKDNYYIGETVWLHKKRLRVCSKKGILQKGLIYFSYILATDSWTWRERMYNPLFPGISLKATVLQCHQEYVRLHLDIDSIQDVKKAYPFLWKPETGNLLYCMPEVGTKVYLNIVDREEGNAYAVGCIRLNGAVCLETQNPNNRLLANESGKNVKLYPEFLEFQGRENNDLDSTLSLRDSNGVSFQTNQSFTVKAENGVQFKGKKVKLASPMEFTVIKKDLLSPTVMNLNHTIDILGGKGKITSGVGKELMPLIQGKRVEKYDISDIAENILSAIPREAEEDELSVILAASFVSTLYSRKLGKMSVKTGAVGSNPKIDKLINVSANSLRGFAATSMVSDLLAGYVDISATNMAETNNLNHDEAYAVAEDSRKEVRENRDKMIISPKLPDEGIYVKDFDDGNIVQQYKKAADERQLQMQAAATLAFAEDYALRRNGIQEGERENFFSGYLSMESEYLVAGALLTCSQATNETIHIPDPDAVVETLYVYEGSEGKTENPLLNVANLANDGSARYATVSDTKRGINIIPFRNCRLINIGKDGDIVLQNSKKCQKYGTCYALMDLCDEWVNVQPGAEYGTADDAKKNCINMLSHLGCYQGGMIFPLDTGQGELEDEIESESVSKEDIISENRYLTEEEMQTNARYIYDYLSDAGWSHNAICGVFGNMQYESNFSPGTWLRHKENSAAFGISQWNPADKYFEWAEKAGLDPYDIDVQLSRILLEVEHDQIKHWQGWRHEANMSFEDYTHSNEPVEYLAEIYLRCYERPGDPDSEVLNRAKAARYWSDYFFK